MGEILSGGDYYIFLYRIVVVAECNANVGEILRRIQRKIGWGCKKTVSSIYSSVLFL